MSNPELPESPDFVRPKPPLRAMTIHELRRVVSARHKYLASSKPIEEAVALVRDTYRSDDDSSLAFVEWLRGGEASLPPTKGQSIERIHVQTDPETGLDSRVETQPGSIPPRRV